MNTALPAPQPPDFVLDRIRTMSASQLWQILREGDPFPQMLILVTLCALVAAIVFWVRGAPLNRFAVATYSLPAVAATVGFAFDFHDLGNNLGFRHGNAYELRPLFVEIFIRLYLGVFISIMLVFFGTGLHAFYSLRIRSDATKSKKQNKPAHTTAGNAPV